MKTVLALVLALLLLAAQAIACQTFNGTSEVLHFASPVTARPVTICARFRPSADGQLATIVYVGDKDVNAQTQIRLRVAMHVAGDPLRASETADAGTLAVAETSNGMSVNQESRACASFVSATSRTAVLDNGTEASNATSLTTTFGNFDRVAIGAEGDSTPTEFFAGTVCDVGVWNVELNSTEKQNYMNGSSPANIRPASLVGHYLSSVVDPPQQVVE